MSVNTTTSKLSKRAMNARGIFAKDCVTAARYANELRGYNYIGAYLKELPALKATDNRIHTLYFEDISSKDNICITDTLSANTYTKGSLLPVFTSMANIYRQYKTIHSADGGTKLFYLNRLERLDNPLLISSYASFIATTKKIDINNTAVTMDASLIEKVLVSIKHQDEAQCAPSQGDLHERNIFTNGMIVDYEAAGWNAVTTDIATFIWHTLFAGSYFGPRYAGWATFIDYLIAIQAKPDTFKLTGNDITFRVNKARRTILNDYRTGFIDEIGLTRNQEKQVLYAIAFRLLSMFSPSTMPVNDRAIAFGLANLCIQKNMTLAAFIELMTENIAAIPQRKLAS